MLPECWIMYLDKKFKEADVLAENHHFKEAFNLCSNIKIEIKAIQFKANSALVTIFTGAGVIGGLVFPGVGNVIGGLVGGGIGHGLGRLLGFKAYYAGGTIEDILELIGLAKRDFEKAHQDAILVRTKKLDPEKAFIPESIFIRWIDIKSKLF